MENTERICVEVIDNGNRLDNFIHSKIPGISKSQIKKLIEFDQINIEYRDETSYNKKIKSGTILKGNEIIYIKKQEPIILDLKPENIPLDIVYEDNDIVIINKQENLVVHPSKGHLNGTLVNGILYHIDNLSTINGVIRPGIVHRLDKNTTGLIIICKNDNSHIKFSEMFKNHSLQKTYVCICKGVFKEKTGKIVTNIFRNPRDRKTMAVREDGKIAITNYEIIDETKDYSLVKVIIETGRTHQIRVHMKYLNHPVLGDEIYGKASKLVATQMLHSYNLKFIHPIIGKEMNVYAKFSGKFMEISKKIGLNLEKV